VSAAPDFVIMFIRYFRDSPPHGRCGSRASPIPGVWSGESAREAEARGQRLLAEVGFRPPGARIDKRIELQFGEPIRFPTRTILPLSWKPAGLDSLLPRLEAHIEVGQMGPERTQLSISPGTRHPWAHSDACGLFSIGSPNRR
jgi:hypothetical protein